MTKKRTESDRLLELHQAHVRAWNEFDLGTLGRIYDPQCYIFDSIPPPVFKSLAEFLEYMTPAIQAFNAFSLRTFDQIVRVDERRDDRIGWIVSRYEMEARRGEGVHRRCGRWTEIYEKREDAWRLIHLHSSDDPQET